MEVSSLVYLVGDVEDAKAFMLMKYGTNNFYDRSFNLVANKKLATLYPYNGKNLYNTVKLSDDFLEDLVILLVPFAHIESVKEEQGLKLNNLLKTYKDWQNLDSYQASLVIDRLLSSTNKEVKINSDLASLQKQVSRYISTSNNNYRCILPTTREKRRNEGLIAKEAYLSKAPLFDSISSKKPKPTKKSKSKKEFVQQCNYSELCSLVNDSKNYKQISSVEDAYFSDFDASPRNLSDFLTKYFGSEYWNLPVTGYQIEYNGKFFAGYVSINVTGLSTSVLVNGYHSMREDWRSVDYYNSVEKKLKQCYDLYKDTDFYFKDAIPLNYTPLTLLDLTNRLVYKDNGIFLEMGLIRVKDDGKPFIRLAVKGKYRGYMEPVIIDDRRKDKLYKTNTRYAIQEWKSSHQRVVERAKYGESNWLHRDLSEIVTPQPNTKIIYVCYLPETGVIKVGRTRNWGSRKGVYSRFKGDSKLTSGIMRLCYYWNVISTGDEVVDRFLMYCAEDHVKRLANSRMKLVEGNEFFKGADLNEFIREVRDYFESISISDLIGIRNTSKIKRFCKGESYDYARLIQKLQELKEGNKS